MKVGELDFGPKDARHAYVEGEESEKVFSRVFIHPYGINIDDFVRGSKSFIYGIKGSGKSALLRYLDIGLKNIAHTEFVYFSNAIREIKKNTKTYGEAAGDSEAINADDPDEYWTSFFFILIARIIYRNAPTAGWKYLEFVRRQTTKAPANFFQRLLGQAPTLETWTAQLGGASQITASGKFQDAINIHHFYESAVQLLSESTIQRPIYIFVDELEVAFHTEADFERDVRVAESLIRTIRDINEQFRKNKIPVFIISAIRTEVANNVVGGDIRKIVFDRGEAIVWERSAKSTSGEQAYHPLFEIALNRIFFSSHPDAESVDHDGRKKMVDQFFPFYRGSHSERYLLDLTTYRPRDIAILFGEAKQIDRLKDHFEFDTFKKKVRQKLRNSLWADFAEALQSRYSKRQVEVFGQIFFSLPNVFTLSEFNYKLDDFSGDPEIAQLIDTWNRTSWNNILKDLYEVGAVGYTSSSNYDDYRFYFRGNTDALILGKSTKLVKPNGLQSPT